jgi:hypothetical protein
VSTASDPDDPKKTRARLNGEISTILAARFFGDFLAAVSDVGLPPRPHSVDELVALVIRHHCALATRDRDERLLARRRERVKEWAGHLASSSSNLSNDR